MSLDTSCQTIFRPFWLIICSKHNVICIFSTCVLNGFDTAENTNDTFKFSDYPCFGKIWTVKSTQYKVQNKKRPNL